jgi:hypothetical protein
MYVGCPRTTHVCTQEENTLPMYIRDCGQYNPRTPLQAWKKLKMQELTSSNFSMEQDVCPLEGEGA